MESKSRWILSVCALILIGDFVVLRLYGDTLRSTNLFIVRDTVFYPLSWLNLLGGIALSVFLIWGLVKNKRLRR